MASVKKFLNKIQKTIEGSSIIISIKLNPNKEKSGVYIFDKESGFGIKIDMEDFDGMYFDPVIAKKFIKDTQEEEIGKRGEERKIIPLFQV